MSATSAAVKYAKDVKAGKVLACEFVRLACERFLDDFRRDDIYLDRDAAEDFVHFYNQMPITRGPKRGELQQAAPWQCFIFVNIFGWRYRDDDRRRFTEVYIEVPRKNLKSTMAASIGLFMLCLDGEPAAEIYCGATKEEQANYVFKPAKQMVQMAPDLQEEFGIMLMAESISIPEDESFFRRVVGEPGDGGNPHCAIVDEYHEHKRDKLYQTFKTGMGAQREPLLFNITTAGDNIEGPCYEKRDEVIKVLKGVFRDSASDSVFGLIYGLDTEDDWQAEQSLIKANPNYGISVDPKGIRRDQVQAQRSTKDRGDFITKRLNRWMNATDPFLVYEEWKACADPGMRLEDMDFNCLLGVDLAQRIDFVASVKCFIEQREDGKVHYYWFPEFWLPEERVIEKGAPKQYREWADAGLINTCEGDEITTADVKAALKKDIEQYRITEVVFDPWKSAGYEQDVEAFGAEVIRFPQTVGMYTSPMWELEAAVKSGRLHHPDHDVLNWMASNLEVRRDTNGNVKPRKENPTKKIDGMSAGVMAIGRAMHYVDDVIDLGETIIT